MKRSQKLTHSDSLDAQRQIIRYLLDDMDDVERSYFEEEIPLVPTLFDEIASVEDDLIMQYLRGELGGRQRARFVEVYMRAPSKRARVESARILREAVLASREARNGVFYRRPRLTTAALVLAAVTVLVAGLFFTRKTAPKQAPAHPDISRISLVLEPGLTRGDTGTQLDVMAKTREVSLELMLPNVAVDGSYHVIIGTVEQPAIWNGLAIAGNGSLLAIVPAEILAPGDYSVQLQHGKETVATYYFRVAK
jgi:hypothetical protein